ncbi:hypothetical protein NP233_g11961 [Leucocoprinus birnbaumii]|uniref:Uncharacterized protein n=1 Tax=Leucocoprinus birnbaumii TaxID=56174 RepID=A0AAD5VFC2_9AGAR|nr:hypothetical protein NP233_g11961 [Leucocoprinus birnbaumii]
MKLSTPLALLALVPLVTQVSAGIVPRQNRGGNNGGGNNGGNFGGANKGGAANGGANANNGGAANGGAANGGANNNNGGANNGAAGNNSTDTGANNGAAGNATDTGNNNGDPQTSLTLDPRVIAKGFANNGQDVPTAGQVASLTSTNNFINFCLTVPNLPLTNGQQIPGGSCNPAPIGAIPSSDKMPSSKFTNPKNGDTIPADQAFTISMAINNLETGNFVNANENYFSAPQQLSSSGLIVGHSHVVVEQLDSLAQATPTDPKKFAFFKGLNAAAANGVLTADVTNGLPAAAYRLCSINAAANHQPAIVPIAQHGSLDDCVYVSFLVGLTLCLAK